MHRTSVATFSAQSNILDRALGDIDDLVEVDVGLFVAPRAHKDVAHLHISLGLLNLGHVGDVHGQRHAVGFSGQREGAITLSLPHTALGTSLDGVAILGGVGVEGDEIVFADVSSSSSHSHIVRNRLPEYFYKVNTFF